VKTVAKSAPATTRFLTLPAIILAVSKPLYIFLLFAALYLLTPTADYFWDGITFALQIEKVANGERGISLLFHQSHLLYNIFGYFLYQFAHLLGWQVRALDLLQGVNSLIGATGVVLSFVISHRLTKHQYASAIGAGFLGVSVTWWKLSTDCDAYILATTLLLLSLLSLTSRKPRWYVAALFLALAMLMHELASLFTFAALAIVWQNDGIVEKRKFAFRMAASAWAVAVGAYYVSAATMFGLVKPLDVIKWATTNPSLITPERNPIPGLLITPRTNIDLLFGHSFTLFRQEAGFVIWAFVLAFLIFAALFIRRAWQGERVFRLLKSLRFSTIRKDTEFKQLLLSLAVWVIPYNILLCFFEPQDPYLRLFYAPALALFIAICLARFHSAARESSPTSALKGDSETPSGAAGLAVLAFASFNLAFFILIFMQAKSNPLVVQAKQAGALWTERSLILFARRNEADTTFEYFNTRTKWRRVNPELSSRLTDEIEAIQLGGGDVWLNKGALAAVGQDVFQRFEKGREIIVNRDFSPAHYVQLLPKSAIRN
jgi:hypothetical protein